MARPVLPSPSHRFRDYRRFWVRHASFKPRLLRSAGHRPPSGVPSGLGRSDGDSPPWPRTRLRWLLGCRGRPPPDCRWMTLLIVAVGSASNALLTRSMSFGVSRRGSGSRLLAMLAAIAAAAVGAGPWALVLQQVVLAVTTMSAFFIVARTGARHSSSRTRPSDLSRSSPCH